MKLFRSIAVIQYNIEELEAWASTYGRNRQILVVIWILVRLGLGYGYG